MTVSPEPTASSPPFERSTETASVAIFGAGPAGLMAAEWLSLAGLAVTIHDRMPSPGRKFLMAGRGGLNLTHGEDLERFMQRYGAEATVLAPMVLACSPAAIRAWSESLGEPTFTGSSGRVFPKSFKASPLLRAWLRRLQEAGVTFRFRSRWCGWDGAGRPLAADPDGAPQPVETDATLLALGGASWPRLGSDGAWQTVFREAGLPVHALEPANAGVNVPWSPFMAERFAGQPLKRIALSIGDETARGEAIVTRAGLEGGAVYALFQRVREELGRPDVTDGITLHVDLRPDLDVEMLAARLGKPEARVSVGNRLRRAGLPPVAAALMRESSGLSLPSDAVALARLAKRARLTVTGTAGLERAISSAGGVPFAALDGSLMLRGKPGTFLAGEMLDWEAPTGGYLLQAAFATGAAAAQGILRYLGRPVLSPDWIRASEG